MILAGAVLALAPGAALDSQPRPAAAALRPGSLCTAGETPLFTCPIGRKTVSVCHGRAGASYRFGRPGKVELASRDLAFASTMYSGGGEQQITATAGQHRYTVYSRIVRTRFDGAGNDPAESSGLIVRRGDRTLLSARCASAAQVDAAAAAALPKGTFEEE